jgi:hypothetical protein
LGNIVLVGKMRKVDLLISGSRQVEAKVIEKRVRQGRNDDDHLLVYEAMTPDGRVSGSLEMSPEEWDQIEMGRTIPVWYATADAKISQGRQPTREQQLGARDDYYLFLLVMAGITAACLYGYYVTIRRERRLAESGTATLAIFNVKSTESGGEVAQQVAWSLPGNDGQIVELLSPTTKSANPRYQVGSSGQGVLLISADGFKPWRDFEWVQIDTSY